MNLFKEKRGADREAVLKMAKIEWGSSVVDCLVHEQSITGVRVNTSVPMNVPEHVMIHLRGGAVRAATQRWALGTAIGFEYVGNAKLDSVAANNALAILNDLRATGLGNIATRLAEQRCFDDAELGVMARAAQAAMQRLEAALQRRAEGNGR